jgi:hypothetical protein
VVAGVVVAGSAVVIEVAAVAGTAVAVGTVVDDVHTDGRPNVIMKLG